MPYEYYSDKICGPRKPTVEKIPPNVWLGIHAIIIKWYNENAFLGMDLGHKDQFIKLLLAENPRLLWPIGESDQPDDIQLFDLIQFCYKNILCPTKDHYDQYQLEYHPPDREIGQYTFRDEINLIFKRNGIIFQLDGKGSIIRLIPDEFVTCIQKTIFYTSDQSLDQLLEISREKFLDSDPDIRKDSLEKLWDAWERLKTIEHADKKKSMSIILEKISPEKNFRERLDSESKELTEIGNKFRIRHHETDKIPIESSNQVDYLFFRMFSLIYLILKSTNRIR